MRLEIEVDYLPAITLGKHQWVSVDISDAPDYDSDIHLPDFRVTVFDDCVYVATSDDVRNHRDGQKVWHKPSKLVAGRTGT